MITNKLSQLLSGELDSSLQMLAYQHFMENEWPHKPFVIHHLHDTIKSLTELPFLYSIDALLNAWPYSVSAHLPDASDESSAIDTTPIYARKLFNNKMALLFNNVEKISPELKNWISELKSDLELPTSTYGRCIVYATPDGKGTAPHFDQNINFVIQLSGEKKWTLEENKWIQNPTERFTMGQLIDEELLSYAESEPPTKLSKNKTEIILQPGSMLFVPRGYWHSTEASGEALALNFTFNQPTFSDLFLAALRSRINLSSEWRELADGVNSKDDNRKMIAREKLDLLLSELTEDLPNWNATDILGATEGA